MYQTLCRVALVMLALATLCLHRASACSCGSLPNAPGNCAEFKATGPSFVGTVIDIENPPDERRGTDESGLTRYRFRVDEDISGFEAKEVDVYSGRGGADCSYHFRLGQSYFVAPFKATAGYARMYGAEPGKLMAGICTETQPVASAGALLAELRARKRGSIVEGVLRTKHQPHEYNEEMANVTVELRGAGSTLSTQTDINGVFRFTGIPSGTFQLAARLPPEFPKLANTPSDTLPSITVTDQACYTKNIYALPNAVVKP